MYKIMAALTCCMFAAAATAQTEKIETDRPDQTESPFTVPSKWIQMEMGFLKQADRFAKSSKYRDLLFQHPALLTKYGLGHRFEFRVITEVTTEKSEASNATDVTGGMHSIQLGGKVNFFDEKGSRPKTSLIAHYDFGFLRKYGIDTADGFNFRFTMQHTLSPALSLGYNLGMRWEKFVLRPAYIYTFAPGFSISEKWYAYVEAFGFIWRGRPPENSIDGGVAYYINDNFKIDASAGLGISKEAPDRYFAIGASFRFKNVK